MADIFDWIKRVQERQNRPAVENVETTVTQDYERPSIRTVTQQYDPNPDYDNTAMQQYMDFGNKLLGQLETNPTQVGRDLLGQFPGQVPPEKLNLIRTTFHNFFAGKPLNEVYTTLFSDWGVEDAATFTWKFYKPLHSFSLGKWIQAKPNEYMHKYADILFSMSDNKSLYEKGIESQRHIVTTYRPDWLEVADFLSLQNFGGQVFRELTSEIWKREAELDLNRFVRDMANTALSLPESSRNIEGTLDWFQNNLPQNFLEAVSPEVQNKFLQAYMPEAIDQMAETIAIDAASTGEFGGGKIIGIAVVGLIAIVGIKAIGGKK